VREFNGKSIDSQFNARLVKFRRTKPVPVERRIRPVVYLVDGWSLPVRIV